MIWNNGGILAIYHLVGTEAVRRTIPRHMCAREVLWQRAQHYRATARHSGQRIAPGRAGSLRPRLRQSSFPSGRRRRTRRKCACPVLASIKEMLPDPLLLLLRHIRGAFRKTVLAYPNALEPGSVLFKICNELGCRTTDDIAAQADVVIHWEDCSFRPTYAVLEDRNRHQRVLNLRCKDISKRRVDEPTKRFSDTVLKWIRYGIVVRV